MSQKTLLDLFPAYLTDNALFTKMSALGAPWDSSIGQDMDDAYFTMYSGLKNASKFVTMHLNPDSDTANSLSIARILWGVYGQSWGHIWDAAAVKYNPVQNYDMTESRTGTRKDERDISVTETGTGKDTTSGTDTHAATGETTLTSTGDTTDSLTSNATDSLAHGLAVTTDSTTAGYTYGFNSTAKVPSVEEDVDSTVTNSGTDTTTKEGTDNRTVHSTQTDDGTSKDDLTITKQEEINRTETSTTDTMDNLTVTDTSTLTRAGNVGVTTTQQMLQSEFELWKWNFFTQVFEDTDKYLALSVYTRPCHSPVNWTE